MSGIKRTLDETWYEHSSRIELHWMEEEYFSYIAKPKKIIHETIQKQEKESHKESERPYILLTQKNDFRD